MVNSDYISARDNWNNDTQPREREEILRQLGYNTQENTTWDKAS